MAVDRPQLNGQMGEKIDEVLDRRRFLSHRPKAAARPNKTSEQETSNEGITPTPMRCTIFGNVN